MGLTINELEERQMANVTVDRRLWLTADKTELVEDGDPDAAFLWANEGREVPAEEAERYGYEPSGKSSAEADNVCSECGFEAKNAGGLAAHQRSHDK